MSIAGVPRMLVQPETLSPLHEFLRLLNRQRARLFWASVLGAGVVIGIGSLLPTWYTAHAAVSVVPAPPDPLQPATTLQVVGDNDVATEAAQISARDVAAKVVSDLGINVPSSPLGSLRHLACGTFSSAQWPPAQWLSSVRWCNPAPSTLDKRVDSFLAQLSATPEPRARVINLSLRNGDPELAAKALNALVEDYQQSQVAIRAQALDQTSSWLGQRASELRTKWLEAGARAGGYRTTYGLTTSTAVGSDGPVVSQEVAFAARAHATAAAALATAEALQIALHGEGAAGADDPLQAPLTLQLGRLMVQQAQTRALHGDGYPEVAAIQKQIAAARAHIDSVRTRAVQAVDTDVVAKRAALERLTRNLAQLGSQSSSLASRTIRLMQLENEARSAQTVYEQFLSRAKEFDGRSQLLRPLVQFVAHAAVPGEPSFPDRTRLALGGVILGLLAGLGYVLAHEHLMRGFSNLSRVSQGLAVPLLCAVPLVGGRRGRHGITDYVVKQPLSQAAEAMRALAMHLRLSAGEEERDQVRSLVVASATGKEGKTTSCLWLAATLAQTGLRVLLIDGDHRRGAIATRLGGCTDAGFAEVLNGTAALGDVTQHAGALGIDFVGSGQPMACVSSGAGLRRLREILGGLRGRYDFVLIDTPPLLAMTDALAYANVADHTVLMCRWRSTTRQAVVNSLGQLDTAGARLLGVAVTMVDSSRLSMFRDDVRPADTRLLAGYYSVQ